MTRAPTSHPPRRTAAHIGPCIGQRQAPGRGGISAWLASTAAAGMLAGCASAPPLQLVVLPTASPVAAAPRTANATATDNATNTLNWQLVLPVRLPDYLDRNGILVPQGPAGLQALPEQRWAEPLRESVPRLLRQDLATLLGESRVWTAPLPAGLVVQRQVRVELTGLDVNDARNAVLLRARWTLVNPAGAQPPRIESAVLSVPSTGSDAQSLALAHRLALWRLAERIATGATAP